MWVGGVRVAVVDEKAMLLMVSQQHEGREIWMLPGGGIEAGETALEAARREVFEETGLKIVVGDLIWHVEEVSPHRGQRFVNYFLAKIAGGSLKLGRDPELSESDQVLRQIRFMNRTEIDSVDHLYPPFLKREIWDILDRWENSNSFVHHVYRKRTGNRV